MVAKLASVARSGAMFVVRFDVIVYVSSFHLVSPCDYI